MSIFCKLAGLQSIESFLCVDFEREIKLLSAALNTHIVNLVQPAFPIVLYLHCSVLYYVFAYIFSFLTIKSVT